MLASPGTKLCWARTCTEISSSSVLMVPFCRMYSQPGLSPVMPYTVKQKTSAETIWKGVIAITLAG